MLPLHISQSTHYRNATAMIKTWPWLGHGSLLAQQNYLAQFWLALGPLLAQCFFRPVSRLMDESDGSDCFASSGSRSHSFFNCRFNFENGSAFVGGTTPLG